MYKRGVLEQVTSNDRDTVYVKKLQQDFMNSMKLFDHLMEE